MSQIESKEYGFTLLEMMLVLTLLAGAGFVLLVKLPNHWERDRLSFVTTQLLEEIRDTRQAALAENDWYQIKFYTQGEPHYQIFKEGTRIKDISLLKGIKFLGQPKDLLLNASGRSAGTTILLTNSLGEQRSVIVAPVGMRIREK
ncbi:prepilin-type N-terminal cleavage/methylation domain-containing protein [Desulfosporosinus acidiphilus SJ4]|uniref:Prepilin-type N-terminal cleavage/methylation domain-containing protein n=1 Tax=Desulfosporosinus acidiphilus (strain DSM 22704 / JCM 16185 / SJ4) TaxID=646529 RepID=I4D8Z5_DESAJ|nr:prepilin-type N-terminal cleavage/methylation domain-containing protein [Desulfosporosinus acidiphilus]AFM42269.1 prepilin-type N-terminal cleavage/methylation domain-containing protein [Desulfosporosinus acidiphilus SJ4]